ncbi:hypothetical protein ACGFOU_07135 [Streptomyces sp. NPDC048595]|uniref:hypothetical protein n=1 Tax=Streptomyces sp. NPDC048595 TaxID=3365576 RepID=UPI003710C950
MTRTRKAVVLAALTLAAAAAAAAPATADAHRTRPGQISTFDHHVPIVGNLGTSEDVTPQAHHS